MGVTVCACCRDAYAFGACFGVCGGARSALLLTARRPRPILPTSQAFKATQLRQGRRGAYMVVQANGQTIVIGLAADSGERRSRFEPHYGSGSSARNRPIPHGSP